jgi:hypothetical protein
MWIHQHFFNVFNIFKNLQGLITCNHINVHLKWKTNSLNLNTLGNEYLAFDSSSYTFLAKCVNAALDVQNFKNL